MTGHPNLLYTLWTKQFPSIRQRTAQLTKLHKLPPFFKPPLSHHPTISCLPTCHTTNQRCSAWICQPSHQCQCLSRAIWDQDPSNTLYHCNLDSNQHANVVDDGDMKNPIVTPLFIHFLLATSALGEDDPNIYVITTTSPPWISRQQNPL